MVILQQPASIQLTLFEHVAEFVFERVLTKKVLYLLTDQYKSGSIKSYEHEKRKASDATMRVRIKKGNKSSGSNGRNNSEMIKIN